MGVLPESCSTRHLRQPENTVSDEFVEQVGQALRHLYDLRYLQSHPLALRFARLSDETGQTDAGLQMQQILLSSIEDLDRGQTVASHAPHSRTHRLLRHHFVQRETIQEAAQHVGISPRQAHRDLKRGEESIAALVFHRLVNAEETGEAEDVRAEQLSSVQAEIAQLALHVQPVDLWRLLMSARDAVGAIAAARNVQVDLDGPKESVEMSTDPVIARQVLISILSCAIKQAQLGRVHVALEHTPSHVDITLRCSVAARDLQITPLMAPVAVQLAQRLDWHLSECETADGESVVRIRIGQGAPVILVIDDNAGLVKLIERYLSDQACNVMIASDGYEGIGIVKETTPDAVVLDVMMPGIDGWEVLQWIRNNPKTTETPVVVCSVIDDPELAYSLGASLFVRKPVTRGRIIAALSQVGVIPGSH